MTRIELVPVTDLEPAAYNPREADETRLNLLTLSLRKLGFILPLYANQDGHLLSGHQRLLAATNLGATRVPVVRVSDGIYQTRNVNLIFNRATNDMRQTDTSDTLWGSLDLERIFTLADAIPDKAPDTDAFYRCLHARESATLDLLSETEAIYDGAAVTTAARLLRLGIKMPVVRTDTGRIVNGVYRLMAAAEYKDRIGYRAADLANYPAVTISEAEAELSRTLLNLISMRFTLENQYADQLRYGAFRRPQTVIPVLGYTWRTWVHNKLVYAEKSFEDPDKFWAGFKRVYGTNVLDFGAGQRRNEQYIRDANRGITMTSWEPYPVDEYGEVEEGNDRTPSLELARRLTDNLLDKVRSGEKFTAIGLQSVLNSVPFAYDRLCVCAVVHGLSSYRTLVSGACRNRKDAERFRSPARMRDSGKIIGATATFKLDYEPGITLGDISVMPKVQKFHTAREVEALLKTFWTKVQIIENKSMIFFKAQYPRRVNPAVLKRAILHEFDLPYPDGQRIDRAEAALEAFGVRLGIDFPQVEAAPIPAGAAGYAEPDQKPIINAGADASEDIGAEG